ncbi:MAG: hypothetical protein HAW67_01335 [Endozoicomonadaceae bacterium]|nr:hypothetical protein [Endozoicomonadaceae bacterium]
MKVLLAVAAFVVGFIIHAKGSDLPQQGQVATDVKFERFFMERHGGGYLNITPVKFDASFAKNLEIDGGEYIAHNTIGKYTVRQLSGMRFSVKNRDGAYIILDGS